MTKRRDYLRQRQDAAREMGCCIWCTAYADDGLSLCQGCRAKQVRRYAVKRVSGICTKCGERSDGGWACEPCREAHNARRREARTGRRFRPPRDLYEATESELEHVAACKRYVQENNGRRPSAKSGDAERYLGYPGTWASLNTALRRGQRGLPVYVGLPAFLDHHGIGERSLPSPAPSGAAFIDGVLKGARRFIQEHGCRPSQRSGPADSYVGWPTTWSTIERNLISGRRIGRCFEGGIGGLLDQHGIGEKLRTGPPSKIPLGELEETVERGARLYIERNGRRPSAGSGRAEPYVGHPVTWGTIDNLLRKGGGGGLRAFLDHRGIGKPLTPGGGG